ncbi:MAG: helix-turn-helix transcriptional regulator [Alphaproteobacteria bacterium]|nr:helix-turn-helix transcriptional regulator [Alphaproteobacteria bacterium]
MKSRSNGSAWPIWLIFIRCSAGGVKFNTTRETLFHTSRELMLQNGYHAVSVDDICARANVKKGSFYHFF